MSNSRITRNLAKNNEELRREAEDFDPFVCNRSIRRSDSVEEIKEIVTHEPKPKAFKETFCKPEVSTSRIFMAAQPIPLKDALNVVYYSPSKRVHQLLGEMGNEYQKDHETVISFANRIRN